MSGPIFGAVLYVAAVVLFAWWLIEITRTYIT